MLRFDKLLPAAASHETPSFLNEICQEFMGSRVVQKPLTSEDALTTAILFLDF